MKQKCNSSLSAVPFLNIYTTSVRCHRMYAIYHVIKLYISVSRMRVCVFALYRWRYIQSSYSVMWTEYDKGVNWSRIGKRVECEQRSSYKRINEALKRWLSHGIEVTSLMLINATLQFNDLLKQAQSAYDYTVWSKSYMRFNVVYQIQFVHISSINIFQVGAYTWINILMRSLKLKTANTQSGAHYWWAFEALLGQNNRKSML